MNSDERAAQEQEAKRQNEKKVEDKFNKMEDLQNKFIKLTEKLEKVEKDCERKDTLIDDGHKLLKYREDEIADLKEIQKQL